jgi:hypothetical protein
MKAAIGLFLTSILATTASAQGEPEGTPVSIGSSHTIYSRIFKEERGYLSGRSP